MTNKCLKSARCKRFTEFILLTAWFLNLLVLFVLGVKGERNGGLLETSIYFLLIVIVVIYLSLVEDRIKYKLIFTILLIILAVSLFVRIFQGIFPALMI